LKIWPFFDDVASGRKRVEIRRDDRGFEIGDRLLLREWDPRSGYTGREVNVLVTHVLRGWGLPNLLVALSISLDG
jgi:hypothetical protein